MDGDEAFYFLHQEGYLKGEELTHEDGFNLAGKDDFIEEVLEEIERELTVSKVKRDKFWFTGLDIAAVGDEIEISMDDYEQIMRDIKDIRKADQDKELS